MPLHKQVTTCLKHAGPVSKFCTCPHCTLSMCSVCGACEGSLTTDCSGERLSLDRQDEICETHLDYTDARGWHQGENCWPKETHFEPEPVRHEGRLGKPWHAYAIVGCSCGWMVPQHILGDLHNGSTHLDDALTEHITAARAAGEAISPSTFVDREALRRDLEQKAIAWSLADRDCEDASAALTLAQDAVHASPQDEELHRRLEQAKIAFHVLDDREQRYDDEFRQAARKIADAQKSTRSRRFKSCGPGDVRLLVGGQRVVLAEGTWAEVEQGPRGEFLRVLERGSLSPDEITRLRAEQASSSNKDPT